MGAKEPARAGAGGLAVAVADARRTGGPGQSAARLRAVLAEELRYGAAELRNLRSGYARPVVVAIGGLDGRLLAAVPAEPAFRADPGAVSGRAWTVVASAVAALVDAVAEPPSHGAPGHGAARAHDRPDQLLAGELGGSLVLALAVDPPGSDPEELAALAALAFDERIAPVDRLRAHAVAVPGIVFDATNDLREPIGAWHPLHVAEAVARLGGDPADEASVAEIEEAVIERIGGTDATVRPHQERDPSLRAARRILQRLAGMGKWGGYHTDIAHLARGFARHDRALALEIAERLVASGLLLEKPSVGQRHVYLNPRRAREIYALIETGELPPGLTLP